MYSNIDINICFFTIDSEYLFYWVIYLNTYNLIWSIIFEMSHFIGFLTGHHEPTILLLWSFSIAFCVTHADLWGLSQYIEFTFHSIKHENDSPKSLEAQQGFITPQQNK